MADAMLGCACWMCGGCERVGPRGNRRDKSVTHGAHESVQCVFFQSGHAHQSLVRCRGSEERHSADLDFSRHSSLAPVLFTYRPRHTHLATHA